MRGSCCRAPAKPPHGIFPFVAKSARRTALTRQIPVTSPHCPRTAASAWHPETLTSATRRTSRPCYLNCAPKASGARLHLHSHGIANSSSLEVQCTATVSLSKSSTLTRGCPRTMGTARHSPRQGIPRKVALAAPKTTNLLTADSNPRVAGRRTAPTALRKGALRVALRTLVVRIGVALRAREGASPSRLVRESTIYDRQWCPPRYLLSKAVVSSDNTWRQRHTRVRHNSDT